MVYKNIYDILALKFSNELIVFLTFSLQKSRPGPNSPYIHIRWGKKSSSGGIGRLLHAFVFLSRFSAGDSPLARNKQNERLITIFWF